MKLLDIIFETVVDLNEKLKPLTQQDFIKRSQQIHKDENGKPLYDYSNVDFNDPNYINTHSIVKINCPIHGTFPQTPKDHLSGSGCSKCGNLRIGSKLSNSVDNFIKRSQQIHKDENGKPLYDYSKSVYKGANEPITIICPTHGPFNNVTPSSHYRGRGCKKCGYKRTGNKLASNKEEFIRKAQNIHKDKNGKPLYGYDNVNYTNAHNKVMITCPIHSPIHGDFPQSPNGHLSGTGCPWCNESKGESLIIQYITKLGYKYTTQKTFEDCTNIHKQKRCQRYKFDFYLTDVNTLIEFDGIQHFNEHPFFHKTIDIFDEQSKDDLFKNKYAKSNGIKLIRIGYLDMKNVEEELTKGLNSNKQLYLSTEYPKDKGWRRINIK